MLARIIANDKFTVSYIQVLGLSFDCVHLFHCLWRMMVRLCFPTWLIAFIQSTFIVGCLSFVFSLCLPFFLVWVSFLKLFLYHYIVYYSLILHLLESFNSSSFDSLNLKKKNYLAFVFWHGLFKKLRYRRVSGNSFREIYIYSFYKIGKKRDLKLIP